MSPGFSRCIPARYGGGVPRGGSGAIVPALARAAGSSEKTWRSLTWTGVFKNISGTIITIRTQAVLNSYHRILSFLIVQRQTLFHSIYLKSLIDTSGGTGILPICNNFVIFASFHSPSHIIERGQRKKSLARSIANWLYNCYNSTYGK